MRPRTSRPGTTTLTDLSVVTVCVVLVGTALTVATGRSRDSADRVKCASNLRQIGTAIAIYVHEFGEWPRTRYRPETADAPTMWTGAESVRAFAADGPAINDVTAAYRLLLATQDLVSEVFLCQKSPVADPDFARGRFRRDHANFLDERELSYSFANPYPTAAARDAGYALTATLSAAFAVAADVNPGVAPPDSDVTAVTPTDSSRAARRGNSANHDRDGQNVLYGDFHVDFVQNALVGVKRDNIYTSGDGADPARHIAIGPPTSADDSVLLPVADPARWRQAARRDRINDGLLYRLPTVLVVGSLVWVGGRRYRARRT